MPIQTAANTVKAGKSQRNTARVISAGMIINTTIAHLKGILSSRHICALHFPYFVFMYNTSI